ncbi:MAG TPA: hypothetical protein PKL82_05210, partial [Anaerolineaceae bacterium]|nr:hypothetical protein [Anaerolineaceae bacterium]
FFESVQVGTYQILYSQPNMRLAGFICGGHARDKRLGQKSVYKFAFFLRQCLHDCSGFQGFG